MKKLLIVFLIAVLILSFFIPANSQPRKLIRVFLKNKQQAESLYSYQLDFANRHFRRYADVVVTEKEQQFLMDKGFNVEIIHKDLKQTFEQRITGKGDMGDYHTFQEMYDEMVQINSDYPDITKLSSIGKSIEGRDIWAMKVSDNPTIEEDNEPDLLYVGNMHAREIITPEVILHFLNYLVNNYGTDPEITDLIDNREFWLIPTQNPDGHVYVEDVDSWWRKNRRNNGDGTYGVDLNRNYGFKWGYDNTGSSPYTSSQTYRGTGPFSEPESEAIRQLCISHNFVLSLSYHSYGRLWLFPWGYISANTPHHEIFYEIAKNCVAYNGYTPGNVAMGTIYLTNGDTDDYYYGEQTEKNMTLAFTPEVGDEFLPPDNQIPTLCEENLQPNLYLAKIAPLIEDNPYRIYPPATPVINPMDSDNDGSYSVNWTITDDPNNPAVSYQLDELSGEQIITEQADNSQNRWTFNGFSTSQSRYHSAAVSFYSGEGDNLNHHLTTAFPLIVENNAELTFWTWYNIEQDWDYGYVEVSNDGGSSFTPISGNITTNNNPNGTNRGNGVTGSSGGWVEAIFDLSNFAGQTILFRFSYITDEMVTNEGIYIDDIFPVADYENVRTLSDNITATSFMIQNSASGTYYYKIRAKDQDDQWGYWSPLEDIIVNNESDCLLGDVNMDGVITPQDALCAFLIYLNDGNPVDGECDNQCAMYAADVNCTPNGITPGDALYIFLAYLNGEDAPLSCNPVLLNNKKSSNNLTVTIVQIDNKVENEISFSLRINNPDGLKSFGMDLRFPDDLLSFVKISSTELTECWQAIEGRENSAGVLRIGGFNNEAINSIEPGVLATITFQVKPGVKGTGEVWLFNLSDDLTEAKINSCNFNLLTTGIRKLDYKEIPASYSLEQNYPNPFNMETEILYQLPEASFVKLIVYNSMGQKIRTLVSQNQDAGRYAARWDGRDDSGVVVSSGVYFYNLTTLSFSDIKKLLLIK